jgi:hypothetical protein
MRVYALVAEPFSDSDWLIGVYGSEAAARAAFEDWDRSVDVPFYRIEARELDAPAAEWEGPQ